MKRVLPNVTDPATSAITATSADKLAYLSNVKRLSRWFYTGPRYLLSHNIRPVKWATIHNVLGDGFITKYIDPLCLLGTGFGANTSYDMFDIDRRSIYHPSNNPRLFERFLATLDKIGLTTPVIIQSSCSGGIHVYYFFDRDINSFRIASLSQVSLLDAKFEIKDGTLELFPNCKPHDDRSNHKLHRSPLQPNGGGLILDRKGNPLTCGANDNHETQLAAFLELAKASARGNNIDKISRKLDPVYEIFKSKPSKYQHIHKEREPNRVREWRENLEIAMRIGWTGFHQTNELIQKFIEYGVVFLRLNNRNALFEWAYEAIHTAPGYSEFCRHQRQIEARIWDWIDPTLEKEFYVAYCGHPPRSSDRDNFLFQYKNSKSIPTSKAEVYKRARVELVASKLSQTVETILATVSQIPSRTSDVIKLIQTIARQTFGQAFSKNTLYKLHYKHIWMKLIATKKASNIVLVTPTIPSNMEYRVETLTESAFEGSVFGVNDLPDMNLKPAGGETWHSAPCVCSVSISSQLPLVVNGADPDLDPDLDPKNIPLDPDSALPNFDINPLLIQIELSPALIDSDSKQEYLSLNPTDLQSILTPALLDLATDPRFSQTEPLGADLLSRPSHDLDQSIDPHPDLQPIFSPDPIESDLDLIEPNPIHPAHKANDRVQLIDSQNPEHESTGVVYGIIGSRAMVKWDVSRKSNIYPIANLKIINVTPRTSRNFSEAEMVDLYAEKAGYLAQLIPYSGCVVSTIDAQQVHGLVIAVRDLNVYVNWQDGSSGWCAINELRCTYSPCVNNFIEKLINRSQVPVSKSN